MAGDPGRLGFSPLGTNVGSVFVMAAFRVAARVRNDDNDGLQGAAEYEWRDDVTVIYTSSSLIGVRLSGAA